MRISSLRRPIQAVIRRWQRNLLTLTALALGAAAISLIVIIAQGSALRVAESLNGGATARITVGLPADSWAFDESVLTSNLRDQDAVISAGTLVVPTPGQGSVQVSSVRAGTFVTVGIAVASPVGLNMRGVDIVDGEGPLPVYVRAGERTALLGSRAARELGVSATGSNNTVDVEGVPVRITGILRDGSDNGAALSTSLILSTQAARSLGTLPQSRVLIVDVRTAAIDQMTRLLPAALYPGDPEAVSIQAPASPRELRAQLLGNANTLVLAIGGILIGVSAFTIVTTLQIAVMERRREIGISRALGRSGPGVAVGFLIEAMIIAAVGTTSGLLFGIVAGKAWTLTQGWPFVVPPLLFAVPLIGLIVGALAGAWPAWQASRTDPAELLRG